MLLECNNCGAPLDVAGKPDVVKCAYCGASASLQHLRTLNTETPKDWQRPKEWRPPHNVPADSSHTYRYRAGVSVPVAFAVGFGLLLTLASVGGVVATRSTAASSDGTCPATFTGVGQQSLRCRCGAGLTGGAVWGTTIYTADSAVCRAARHAGAIGVTGGEIELRGAPGCPSYAASSANGVDSNSWGSYGQSYFFAGYGDGTCAPRPAVTANADGACPATFAAAGADRVECTCAPTQFSGSVWGSRTYTSDSSLCQAALHAGAVQAKGGKVVARAAPGCASYSGTTAHGVTTGPWKQYPTSFYFEGHGKGACR